MAKCQITGKRGLVGMSVSHAHNRTKKVQNANIQRKRFYLADEDRWIRLRVSTRAIRSISKMGLKKFAAKHGVSLSSLLD
jgi:large subunit ribosomal protein L28